jgi:hypothetical protein
MKEDVLEQIVDDYLQMQGYFTTHNVRFNPPRDQCYVSQTDSVPSDIDVVGLHPRLTRAERVMVVSCKSWQSGFAASHILAQLRGEAKNPKASISCVGMSGPPALASGMTAQALLREARHASIHSEHVRTYRAGR